MSQMSPSTMFRRAQTIRKYSDRHHRTMAIKPLITIPATSRCSHEAAMLQISHRGSRFSRGFCEGLSKTLDVRVMPAPQWLLQFRRGLRGSRARIHMRGEADGHGCRGSLTPSKTSKCEIILYRTKPSKPSNKLKKALRYSTREGFLIQL